MDPVPPSRKRDRSDSSPEERELPDSSRRKRTRTRRRVTALNADDTQQGDLFVVRYSRVYGFVESVTRTLEPVRVQRTGRGAPAVMPPPQYTVSIVFDCLSADWFDAVPDVDAIEWDTVSLVAHSCRVELMISDAVHDDLNQRQFPVFGGQLPPVAEGSWWELKLEPLPQTPQWPVFLTWPTLINPVSTILQHAWDIMELKDLTVPRGLLKLRLFSHGWDWFAGPDDPPYPGR
jgi:hypothetical protein